MKYLHYFVIAAVFSTLFSICAFAADKTARSVSLSDPVTVGSTQLMPGNYKLEWEGSGPSVQVKFLHFGKTVATVPATLQTNDERVTQNDVIMDRTNPNMEALKEIDFAHQKEALTFPQTGM